MEGRLRSHADPRSRCPSDPPLRALRKRLQLHTTDQDLGAFGLKLNLSFRVRGFVSVIDDLSVEDVRKLVVVTDHFLAIPLTGGIFDVLLTAKSDLIFPFRVASVPVEPS